MPEQYSRIQIALHWLVFLLICVQFLFHDGMEDAWHAYVREGVGDATAGALLHIVTGVAVLVFVLWRLALRMRRGAPPLPEGNRLLAVAAHVSHWALYALLVLIPLSGMAAWFLGAGAAAEAHEVLKTVLLVLALIHVAAALFHQFVLRDHLIARMMPRRDAR